MTCQSIRPLERWSSNPGVAMRPGSFAGHGTLGYGGGNPAAEAPLERQRGGDREVVVAVGGGDLDAEREALRR